MKVAIIPARGGSKRIPRKNVREFAGKPMIAHPILTAKKADLFDRIIVSTDDEEVADISKRYGAEVPFFRPPDLANDFATTLDVMAHALETLKLNKARSVVACCIYATTPFVQAFDLRESVHLLNAEDCDYVFSVTSFPFPIQRALRIHQGEFVSMFEPEHLETRSQDLEEAFHDAAQFYWGRADAFLSKIPLFGPRSRGFKIPRHRVQDIDSPEDWKRAEYMFRVLKESGDID